MPGTYVGCGQDHMSAINHSIDDTTHMICVWKEPWLRRTYRPTYMLQSYSAGLMKMSRQTASRQQGGTVRNEQKSRTGG
jgi:hypothetical protein